MKKQILLGNEAIVWAALEAGVNFVSTYPGTPASEIGNLFYKISKNYGVYFEFSANEKVALEAAIGASFSDLKCLVAMKSFGLNVCSDSLLPLCYTGTKGPMVIVVGDDPSCWSSAQSEENTRGYAYLAHIPILEPSDPCEAKEFTKLAFEISEKFKIPVIVRTTTRVAHQRMPVIIEPERISKKLKKTGEFVKDPKRFAATSFYVLEMKEKLLEKIERIRKFAEKSSLNKVFYLKKEGGKKNYNKVGVITSSVSYLYLKEALEELKIELPILKLGFFYPLPENKIKSFIKNLKRVLVIEELEPFLEKEIKILAKEVNPEINIFGKDVLPVVGELKTEMVILAINKLLDKKIKVQKLLKNQNLKFEIPNRFPRFCPGCPHAMVLAAVKKIVPKETIFGGDIGCYMIAGFPPYSLQDYLLAMGSSLGVAHGIKKATNQKVIAFIGDSTFFHAGLPALINVVFNKSNPLIIVMDNGITAMTGHQPNPGEEVKIEEIIKACGIKNIKVIDPINVEEMEQTIKEFLQKEEVSVIISRRLCALLEKKRKKE